MRYFRHPNDHCTDTFDSFAQSHNKSVTGISFSILAMSSPTDAPTPAPAPEGGYCMDVNYGIDRVYDDVPPPDPEPQTFAIEWVVPEPKNNDQGPYFNLQSFSLWKPVFENITDGSLLDVYGNTHDCNVEVVEEENFWEITFDYPVMGLSVESVFWLTLSGVMFEPDVQSVQVSTDVTVRSIPLSQSTCTEDLHWAQASVSEYAVPYTVCERTFLVYFDSVLKPCYFGRLNCWYSSL